MIYSQEVEEMCPVAQGVTSRRSSDPGRSKMGKGQRKSKTFPVLHTVSAGVLRSRVHVS